MLKIFHKINNGLSQTIWRCDNLHSSIQDIEKEKLVSLYEIPQNANTFSYIEINCDNEMFVEKTIQTLLSLNLIELNHFLPWFSTLQILPDYFRDDEPDFYTQRYDSHYLNQKIVLDFYLCGTYEIQSEKNIQAANRLKNAMDILAPKFVLENTLPCVPKKSGVTKI